jgi:hypothetical protein
LFGINFAVIVAFSLPKISPGSRQYVNAVKKVTDVMVNDVTSPVAASRYYAYVTLCAYEVQSLFDKKNYPSLGGLLKGFKKIKVSDSLMKSADVPLAIILSVYKSGERLLPSGYLLKTQIDSLSSLYSIDSKQQAIYNHSAALVDTVLRNLMLYVKADGFTKLTNYERYTPLLADGYWKPTPPAFMAPVEPHWNKVRTFMIDSAQQFRVNAPTVYDSSKTSSYFIELKEVYDIVNSANKKQQSIALFWDCNPFAIQQIGHVEFGLKKISPCGHWIGIAGIACNTKKYSLGKTAFVHALLSIAMADAFIACWDEKYRSNRVRPETAIQLLIDKRWHPLLQTPPFPEYVSGHSVVSSAAAMILTKLVGENFSYSDDTEVEFGLPIRKFSSFKLAAAEASLSRLYGGIHYRDSIEQGQWQGKSVGEWIILISKITFNL